MTWPMAFGWAVCTWAILVVLTALAAPGGPIPMTVVHLATLTAILRMLGSRWA